MTLQRFRVAALQMVSAPEVDANLQRAEALIAEAAAAGAQLVALPEYFCLLGRQDGDKVAVREADGSGPIQQFLAEAARRHGLPAAALSGGGRSRGVVQARNLAMYLARHLTGSSFDSIGVAFGGRDHTTVMRGVRAVELRMTSDAAFAADVELLLADTAQPRRRRIG